MRRVLILGGTGWLGREIASRAMDSGAEVTCLARGDSGDVPEGAQLLRADRRDPDAHSLPTGEWDEVVELAYDPRLVEGALDSLADRAAHWTFVSTISVYHDHDRPGADETAALVELTDPNDYAHAKVAAERATAERLGERLMIARPGLIAGVGDPTDRFGYWVGRLRRGGRVLAPTPEGRFVQVIDVEDLAQWIVTAGAAGVTGIVDAVGEPHTFDDFLTHARISATFDGELHQVDDHWLLEQGVRHWSGPRSLPLWLPPELAGMMQRSNDRYQETGGVIRPLRTTMDLTRDDELARGLDRQRRAGLAPEDEAALLEAYLSR